MAPCGAMTATMTATPHGMITMIGNNSNACPLQCCSPKSMEADKSLKTIGAPSCIASMPACSVSCSACFGLLLAPHLPLDGLPCSDCSCASLSPHLCMPSVWASCSSDQGLPEPFHGDGSGSVLSLLHADQAMLSVQSSNASGFAVVAFLAPPASLMLMVLSVGAGANADQHVALAGHLCIPPRSTAAIPQVVGRAELRCTRQGTTPCGPCTESPMHTAAAFTRH